MLQYTGSLVSIQRLQKRNAVCCERAMSVPVISTMCYNGLDFHRKYHEKSDNNRQGGCDHGILNNQMNLELSLQIFAFWGEHYCPRRQVKMELKHWIESQNRMQFTEHSYTPWPEPPNIKAAAPRLSKLCCTGKPRALPKLQTQKSFNCFNHSTPVFLLDSL